MYKRQKCHGTRLKPEAGYVRVGGKNISELVDLPISELKQFFDHLEPVSYTHLFFQNDIQRFQTVLSNDLPGRQKFPAKGKYQQYERAEIKI